jgi:hypothetical protein
MTPNSKPTKDSDFYTSALPESQRDRLARAKRLKGIDQEIALLRLQLLQLAQEPSFDIEKLNKTVNTLIRALALKYRISERDQKDLSQRLHNAMKELGSQFQPEMFNQGGAEDDAV